MWRDLRDRATKSELVDATLIAVRDDGLFLVGAICNGIYEDQKLLDHSGTRLLTNARRLAGTVEAMEATPLPPSQAA